MICEISQSLLCIDMLVYKPRAVFCFISKRVGKLTRMVSWADIFTVQQSYYCGWYHKGVLADGWSCAGKWFCSITLDCPLKTHDDVIKCKNFLRYWPFVRGIHRSPVNSSHNGRWRGALMSSLISAWINGWINNRGYSKEMHCTLISLQWHYDTLFLKYVRVLDRDHSE